MSVHTPPPERTSPARPMASAPSSSGARPGTAAEPERWSPGWERAGLVALLFLAAGLRFWHLWDIPSPTDELLSVSRGLAIARGEILPLTDFEPYIGALWSYLLATAFRLAGPSEYVGRALPLL